jgi:hypothetical protein
MDKQITGLSGEFFVAAELLKRNLQVSLTLGNAKAVDIIAIHERKAQAPFQVQVKSLRKESCFDLLPEKIIGTHIYVFVCLNEIDKQPDYYIMRGNELLFDLKHYYGLSLLKLRKTVNIGPLKKHKNNWDLFNE